MFRIAFESIYLVGLTSITVLTLFAASPSIGLGRHGTTSTRVVLFTAAGLHALLLGAAATSRYRFRRNKFRPRSALRALRGEIHDDIGLIGLVSLLAAAYALGPAIDTRSPIAVVAAVSPQVATWCILYFHGRTQHGETRASDRWSAYCSTGQAPRSRASSPACRFVRWPRSTQPQLLPGQPPLSYQRS